MEKDFVFQKYSTLQCCFSHFLSWQLLQELEFDEFAPELTTFLERYRELEKNKKNAKAKAAAERAKEANEEKTEVSEKPTEGEEDANDGDASMDEGATNTEVATTAENGGEAGDEGTAGEAKAMEE